METPGGAELLGIVGYIYTQEAQQFLGGPLGVHTAHLLTTHPLCVCGCCGGAAGKPLLYLAAALSVLLGVPLVLQSHTLAVVQLCECVLQWAAEVAERGHYMAEGAGILGQVGTTHTAADAMHCRCILGPA